MDNNTENRVEDKTADKMAHMRELVDILNRARRAYEQEDKEIMSNYEYDRLYDELLELEKELGTTLAASPTVNVGYEVLSNLPKERHERPMLSLDKTKEVERLREFLGNQKAMISWKLDGLTIVLTYRNGSLEKAVTRGNGEVGEVVTNNARVFRNIPLAIPYQGELVLRGEAVISYKDFEKINEEIGDADAKYKNPRNLCSGSVRQLNNEITAKRNVRFYAFTLVQADGVDFKNSRLYQMQWLKSQGFDVVENHPVTAGLRNISGKMKSRRTDWCLYMMISLMDSRSEARRNSHGIRLHLSGRMRSGRRRLPGLNGVRPGPDLSIQWRSLSLWSWRVRQ